MANGREAHWRLGTGARGGHDGWHGRVSAARTSEHGVRRKKRLKMGKGMQTHLKSHTFSSSPLASPSAARAGGCRCEEFRNCGETTEEGGEMRDEREERGGDVQIN
jgi:hypothetical protein